MICIHTAIATMALALTAIAPIANAAQTAATCTAAKYKAAGKATSKMLKCYAIAQKKGTPVDTACLTEAGLELELGFDRIESKGGCDLLDDSPVVLDQIEAAIDEIVLGLACPEKLQAAGKDVFASLKCHAKATKKGIEADQDCLDDAEQALLEAFAKADQPGKCAPGGDAAADVHSKVDELVGTLTGTGCPAPGVQVGGSCWFMAAGGFTSCDTVCTAQGRTCDEAATRDYAGSAGTLANCMGIVQAMGLTIHDTQEFVMCDGGPAFAIGCTYDSIGVDNAFARRLTSPATTCSATGHNGSCGSATQRVCACD